MYIQWKLRSCRAREPSRAICTLKRAVPHRTTPYRTVLKSKMMGTVRYVPAHGSARAHDKNATSTVNYIFIF